MKNIYKKRLMPVAFAALLLVTAGTAEAAWIGPTATPPGGNVDSPINVGGTEQTKSGVFKAWGIRSFVDLIVDDNAYADSFFYNSDRNLKTSIKRLDGSLANILKLEGVSFDWKNGGGRDVGLIAQDVESVFPELVRTNPATGLKSVEYGHLVAPLIEAIKEQQKEIDMLKSKIAELER